MASSTLVNLTITNPTANTVTCVDIGCESFDNMYVAGPNQAASTIAPGGQASFTSSTNDRLFCTWSDGTNTYQLAMTCPGSSHNSACGTCDQNLGFPANGTLLPAGLQTYSRTGSPCSFTFNLGQPNLADWDDGKKNGNSVIEYRDCSWTPDE